MKNRKKVIMDNMGLVHLCAKRFKGKGIEYDDLYSAGCEGLIKAVDRFDESLNYQFSTYAVPVILGEIKRLFRDGGTIKVSRGIKELSLKMQKLSDKITTETGKSPTVDQLAEELNISKEKVSEALLASMYPLPLYQTFDDCDTPLEIPVPCIEENLSEHLSLKEALKDLPPAEQQLIDLRYFKHFTQKKTGEKLNMTQVQVSRKEKRILLDIRKKLTV